MILCAAISCGPRHFTENLQLGTDLGLKMPRKLGLLAGTFEDGSFSMFVVPHPGDLRSSNTQGLAYGEEWNFVLFLIFRRRTLSLVKIEPILRIELQDTRCWTFDWANSEIVAIGCTNG